MWEIDLVRRLVVSWPVGDSMFFSHESAIGNAPAHGLRLSRGCAGRNPSLRQGALQTMRLSSSSLGCHRVLLFHGWSAS